MVVNVHSLEIDMKLSETKIKLASKGNKWATKNVGSMNVVTSLTSVKRQTNKKDAQLTLTIPDAWSEELTGYADSETKSKIENTFVLMRIPTGTATRKAAKKVGSKKKSPTTATTTTVRKKVARKKSTKRKVVRKTAATTTTATK